MEYFLFIFSFSASLKKNYVLQYFILLKIFWLIGKCTFTYKKKQVVFCVWFFNTLGICIMFLFDPSTINKLEHFLSSSLLYLVHLLGNWTPPHLYWQTRPNTWQEPQLTLARWKVTNRPSPAHWLKPLPARLSWTSLGKVWWQPSQQPTKWLPKGT